MSLKLSSSTLSATLWLKLEKLEKLDLENMDPVEGELALDNYSSSTHDDEEEATMSMELLPDSEGNEPLFLISRERAQRRRQRMQQERDELLAERTRVLDEAAKLQEEAQHLQWAADGKDIDNPRLLAAAAETPDVTEEDFKNEECVMCMETLKEGDMTYKFRCGHASCRDCPLHKCPICLRSESAQHTLYRPPARPVADSDSSEPDLSIFVHPAAAAAVHGHFVDVRRFV